MTTQDAMLKLARAYDPSAFMDGAGRIWVDNKCEMANIFDPANNDSQAVAVLCWLLAKESASLVDFDTVYVPADNTIGQLGIEHDRTPASFRAAVTKAALRVVS